MSKSLLQRRLVDVSERLRQVRAELAVSDEQAAFLQEEADDARMRALVSETPVADFESREAQRHAETLARYRESLRRSITELEQERDALLDRMASELADQ